MTKVCLDLGQYETAEHEVRSMIERGYLPDNHIRLGQLLQAQNRLKEAIEAYQAGLTHLGLSIQDLESPAFPFKFPKELAAFTALIGLGECYFDMGDRGRAAQYFHHSAKLRANSHRPFLGFAKLFVASGELDKAEFALGKVGERDGRDPETHRVLGKLCEKRQRLDLAFNCYTKAFELGPKDEKNVDPFFHLGSRLNRWEDMRPVLEKFLEDNPASVLTMGRLAKLHFEIGRYRRALELTEKGLELQPDHPVLKALGKKSREAVEAGLDQEAFAPEAGPLSLDINLSQDHFIWNQVE